MKTFTLDEVKAAFQTLEDHVAKVGADANCTWAIHWAAEDVLAILAGDWQADVAPGPVAPADELWQHESYISGQVDAETRPAGDDDEPLESAS